MISLWVRGVRKQRIVRSEIVELGEDLTDALDRALSKMDLPRPLFLEKHEREWEQFQQTAFAKDHFMESIPFDRVEIERIDPDVRKRKSSDPRNG